MMRLVCVKEGGYFFELGSIPLESDAMVWK
jgi:hypothetical protein